MYDVPHSFLFPALFLPFLYFLPDTMNNLQGGRRQSCQKALVSLAASALPRPVDFDALRLHDDQLAKITNKTVKRFYQVC
jgi:hypothetical protein